LSDQEKIERLGQKLDAAIELSAAVFDLLSKVIDAIDSMPLKPTFPKYSVHDVWELQEAFRKLSSD
jgi:hypothetical protein